MEIIKTFVREKVFLKEAHAELYGLRAIQYGMYAFELRFFVDGVKMNIRFPE